MVVPKRVHRVVWRICNAILVTVRFLHPCLQYSNHLKAGAVDANRITDRGNPRKQFVLGFGSEHHNSGMTHVVGLVNEAAFSDAKRPNIRDGRINAEDVHGKGAWASLQSPV